MGLALSAIRPVVTPPPQPVMPQQVTPAEFGPDTLDYRRALAEAMLAAGSSTAPLEGGLVEGLARLGQGALGGYTARRETEERDARSSDATQAIIEALAGLGTQQPTSSLSSPSYTPSGSGIDLSSIGDERSRQALTTVSPELQGQFAQLYAAMAEAGLDPVVVEGFRDNARQDALYAQGGVTNAPGGRSYHNYGQAVDIVPRALLDTENWSPDSPLWQQAGEIGRGLGFEWGGGWGTPDPAHFQLGSLPSQPTQPAESDGMDIQALVGAIANPDARYAPEGLRNMAGSLMAQVLQQQLTPDDPPSGYRWTTDGGLEPIPGGPAIFDPTEGTPSGYMWADEARTRQIPIPGGPEDPNSASPSGPFEGTSPPAQAANYYVNSGQWTMDEAAQYLGARLITAPSGEVSVAYPQDIVQPQGGTDVISDGRVGTLRQEGNPQAAGYYGRMLDAERNIAEIFSESQEGVSFWNGTAGSLPLVGEMAATDQNLRYRQAAREWISGLLRYDSGAAVPDSEFTRYFGTYFASPWEGAVVTEQKRRSRLARQAEMQRRAGRFAVDAPDEAPPPGGEQIEVSGELGFDPWYAGDLLPDQVETLMDYIADLPEGDAEDFTDSLPVTVQDALDRALSPGSGRFALPSTPMTPERRRIITTLDFDPWQWGPSPPAREVEMLRQYIQQLDPNEMAVFGENAPPNVRRALALP